MGLFFAPRRPVSLTQRWQLFFAIQDMPYQLPVLQILAGVNRDAREGVEAGGGTEESVI